jgi:hypothetical protein
MCFYLARLSIDNIKQRRSQWTEWVTKLVERERHNTEELEEKPITEPHFPPKNTNGKFWDLNPGLLAAKLVIGRLSLGTNSHFTFRLWYTHKYSGSI